VKDARRRVAAAVAAGFLLALQAGGRTEVLTGPPADRIEGRPDAAAGTDPATVPWEPNAGQAAAGVLAVGRGGGATVLVEGGGARVLVPGGAVSLEFRGAGGGPARFGRRLPGVSHYLVGAEASRWIRRVPHHAALSVPGRGPAAAVAWTSRGGRPAYDLAIPAGADPSTLELRFGGAGPLALAADGSLEVPAGDGLLVHSAPVAWQVARGRRVPVEARWEIRGPGRAGFATGARDPSLPLVIDPSLRFVRLLGGSAQEPSLRTFLDADGSLLLAGATASLDFPLAAPLQGTYGGGQNEAFVTRLDPATGAVAWSTFLGGGRRDEPSAVAADAAGVVVAGTTGSSDFPTANAIDSVLGPSDAQAVGAGYWEDGFVTRLSASGDALLWSTYLGGDRDRDFVTGLGFAPDGSLRLCGGSAGFTETMTAPLVVGATTTLGVPKGQAFWAASMAADGSALQWLVAVGYASSYSLSGLAVTPDGDVLVIGTSFWNTYVENALQPTAANNTNYEGWVARVKGDGTGVRWATFLGGTGADYPASVATDAAGAAYVVGTTFSTDFPVTAGAFQTVAAGNVDGFVAKISPDGQTLEYSTRLGGLLVDQPTQVLVDADGVAAVVGLTSSADFPEVAAPEGVAGAGADAFVTRVAPDGGSLLPSFRWGGTDFDSAVALSLRGKELLVGGSSRSPSLPGTTSVPGPGGDLFLLEFDPRPDPALDLRASMLGETLVRLEWTLANAGAGSFRIERRPDGGAWEAIGTAPQAAFSFHDPGVEIDRRYGYRVFALRGPDESIPSNEALVDTTPRAPEGLVATVISSRRVDLSWTDLSEGEVGYEIQREDEGGVVVQVALTTADAEFHSDTTVLPDPAYTWRVRAFHGFAASAWSNDAVATTPATLDLSVRKGTIVLSRRAGRDRARIRGGFEPLPPGEDGFDPREAGLLLVAGGWTGAVVAEVPALDGAWRARGSRYSWKSPRGPGPRVAVVLDTAEGTFSVRARRVELDPEPGTPLRLSLATGEYQGSSEDAWVRRGRRLRFRAGE
jgi:hypothetical protein